MLSPLLSLLLLPSVSAFAGTQSARRVLPASRAAQSRIVASAFEALEIAEKVAVVRAVRNATYADQLTGCADDSEARAAVWNEIRSVQPDCAALADDKLDVIFAELQNMDYQSPAPTPAADAGIATGAVPLAFLAAAVVFGVVSTSGDVVCAGSDANAPPALVRSCTEFRERASSGA